MVSQSDVLREPDGSPENTGRASDGAAREVTATVVHEPNTHGAVTCRDAETHATYHVVDYADPDLRERAAALEVGTAVELRLSRTGNRANVWRVEGLFAHTER